MIVSNVILLIYISLNYISKSLIFNTLESKKKENSSINKDIHIMINDKNSV